MLNRNPRRFRCAAALSGGGCTPGASITARGAWRSQRDLRRPGPCARTPCRKFRSAPAGRARAVEIVREVQKGHASDHTHRTRNVFSGGSGGRRQRLTGPRWFAGRQVAVRVRPFNRREREQQLDDLIIRMRGTQTVVAGRYIHGYMYAVILFLPRGCRNNCSRPSVRCLYCHVSLISNQRTFTL